MATYQPMIQVSARSNLHNLPWETRNALRRVLKDVASNEQPTHHEKAKQLQGFEDIFRVRVGEARAICKLDKPCLLILKVNTRDSVYDDIDELDTAVSADTVKA